MRSPDPYRYPSAPHVRRHGPAGYANYSRYRRWLRDEFDFRCVYCLQRERWGQVIRGFELDHFLPQTLRDDLVLDYDNLVYSCAACNGAKGSAVVAGPNEVAFAECLRVEDNGVIVPLNDCGTLIIDELDLDSDDRMRWRRMMIEIIALVAASDRLDQLHDWMGLPDNLPDLVRLSPPSGNSRPDGLDDSWLARRQRGEEPQVFE